MRNHGPTSERFRIPHAAVWAALLLAPALCLSRVTISGQYVLAGDALFYYAPRQALFAQALADGRLPFWSPALGGGFPQVAESMTSVFYPFSLLLALLTEPVRGYQINVLLHLCLASLFTYAYARQIRLARAAALFAAVAFACGGFFMAQHIHEWASLTGAWLPLELLLVERCVQERRLGSMAWLGVVVALHLLVGHFQLAFYSLVIVGLYAVARGVRGEGSRRVRAGRILAVGGACLAGFVLAAVQLLPTWEYFRESARPASLADYFTLGSLPPQHLLTFAFALVWSPSAWGAGYWYIMGLCAEESVGYVGVAALAAALWGLRHGRDRGLARFWGAAVVISLLLAFGRFTPLHHLMTAMPGLSSFRVPARLLFVVSFGLAVLAGLGLDRMLQTADDARRRAARWMTRCAAALTIVGALLVAPVTIAVVAAPGWTVSRLEALARRLPAQAEALHLIAASLPNDWTYPVLAALLPLALFVSLIVIVRVGAHRPRLLAALILLHALVDLGVAGRVLTGPGIAAADYRRPSAVAEFLAGEPPGARILSVPENLPVLLGRSSAVCFTGFRLRRGDLLDARLIELPTADQLDSGALRLARIATASVILRPRAARGGPAAVAVIHDPWLARLVQWRRTYLYRVPNPLPRAWVASRFEIITDERQVVYRLQEPDFDPDTTVILDRHPRHMLEHREVGGPAAVEIIRDDPQEVVVQVEHAPKGLLVLADTFYPGWEARVDGAPALLVCANARFRAVPIQPGSHRVEFRYRPRMFALGARISVAAAVVWLVFWCAVLAVRRRRP